MKRSMVALVALASLVGTAVWLSDSGSIESTSERKLGAAPSVPDASVRERQGPEAAVTEASALASVDEEMAVQQQKAVFEIRALLSCHETDSCPRDDSDPRASFFLLGEMLVQKVRDFESAFAGTPGFDAQVAGLIDTLLAHENGHVQAEAVNLMSRQPPSTQSARALLSALQGTPDGKLLVKSLPELARYPELESETRALFEHTLRLGSFSASRALAQNLGPYLNEGNVGFYSGLASELPGQAAKTRFLKATLEAYGRSQ
ncbi:hypothetical protein [Biformimicrobium ophioploci]|uniref:Uncharacterized protein n=1 Tax=Biformimicrobium ophioploci TaxID=3036711 RepID=A0ABQ6M0U2_9GAMM|nr:hypothetical protein [Microbulbifer sp. NKW57]GMG87912.1 hypothetical protein MNKW57_22330 [Microbulbifer sp. NKW57]